MAGKLSAGTEHEIVQFMKGQTNGTKGLRSQSRRFLIFLMTWWNLTSIVAADVVVFVPACSVANS